MASMEALSQQCSKSDTKRTLPRKRSPRAAGEVFLTCPASCVYLNSEFNELSEVAEPTYQNDNAQEPKQRLLRQCCRSPTHLSFVRSTNVECNDERQSTIVSTFVDDFDHYYESLTPLNNKRHTVQLVHENANGHHINSQELFSTFASPRSIRQQRQRQHHSASAHALGQSVSDDYDSFDTDTDDVNGEMVLQLKHYNDSGVDIRNVKLPEPPASTNQVYAMVRKLKNLISHKKSPPASANKCGGNSQSKVGESTAQFYVESNIYHNSPTRPTKPPISSSTKSSSQSSSAADYENAEFHAPPLILFTSAARETQNTAEKQLNMSQSTQPDALTEANATAAATTELVDPSTNTTTAPRSKSSKSAKSFKSRLRRSLAGSTQLAVSLTPTRSTFYIAEPFSNSAGSGELDSGFSEKLPTGDLTAIRTINGSTSTEMTQIMGVATTQAPKFNTVARKNKKDRVGNSQRRRTTISMRPHEPPPPPPAADKTQLGGRGTTNTSWYAECGVFKQNTALHDDDNDDECQLLHNGCDSNDQHVDKCSNQNVHNSLTLNNGSHTSWYTEAGLYQTSGVSVASSSGSSGVSTGNEGGGIGDDMPHGLFENEPLYQIYSAAKLQSMSRDLEDNESVSSSTDGYEEIGQHYGDELIRTACSRNHSRPTALQLVEPKNGPSRTLWSEITEVINSCILVTLTPRERALQEAKFEIITSEASYLKSLNLLRSHFMNHPAFRDTNVLSARDRKALFSSIVPVHECSERLLMALESCWQDNIMLLGLSKRIYSIAEKSFHVYISFCEQQGRMDRTLRRLKKSKGTFSQNLDLLESSANCCGLNLHSFLMLPMQRITRLPLLIDAVFSKTGPSDDEYDSWKMTLAIMNKIVAECNEAANRCEQAYEVERIARQLEFPTTVRALAIAPVGVVAPGAKPRFLVKKGELTHLVWRRGDEVKLTFGKKFTKNVIYAFLFSDLLVLTKRKAEEQYQVFDYCPRNMLTISSGELLPQLANKDIGQTGRNLILMTLLENHERKTLELLLSCPSVSEQERWIQAVCPPEAENPGEKLYEQWDCPQVLTTHAYETNEPDALSLEIGDVINVTRKLPDGWYQGERLRDGAIGWFPGNHTEEVNSAHVRARNLKQRYRLLTFTATYLETQKRK